MDGPPALHIFTSFLTDNPAALAARSDAARRHPLRNGPVVAEAEGADMSALKLSDEEDLPRPSLEAWVMQQDTGPTRAPLAVERPRTDCPPHFAHRPEPPRRPAGCRSRACRAPVAS